MSHPKTTSRVLVAAALLGLSAQATAQASATTPGSTATTATSDGLLRVQGMVFDSLTRKRVPGANVWIAGTAHSALTDSSGRFVLDSVKPGDYEISYSAAALDSAGFGTLSRTVSVGSTNNPRVDLTTPSLRTVWSRICKGVVLPKKTARTDSGIFFGTVFDVDSKTRLVKAPALFTWPDVAKSSKKFSMDEVTYRAESDNAGRYVACGVPTSKTVTARAYGNKSASGTLEYTIGQRAVSRLDFTVSAELAGDGKKARGSAVLHGIVQDEHGNRIADANVLIVSADTTVRTNAQGEFTARLLAAGTQVVEVRKIGMGVASRIVDLLPGQTSETSLVMLSAQALAEVEVRATAPGVREADFLERRKIGLGSVYDFSKFTAGDVFTPLRTHARIIFVYDTSIRMNRVVMRVGLTNCFARLFLDGQPIQEEFMATVRPEDLKFAEIFSSSSNLPAQFLGLPQRRPGIKIDSLVKINNGIPCGVVAYWSKRAW